MGINTAIISGRLTRDSELKRLGETDLLKFSVAYSEKYKDKEYATFVDCNLFGTRASMLVGKLLKGQLVTVQGKLRQESWETNGVKQSKLVLIVDTLSF